MGLLTFKDSPFTQPVWPRKFFSSKTFREAPMIIARQISKETTGFLKRKSTAFEYRGLKNSVQDSLHYRFQYYFNTKRDDNGQQ